MYIPITSKEASPFRGNHLSYRGGRQSEGVAEGVVSLLGSEGVISRLVAGWKALLFAG